MRFVAGESAGRPVSPQNGQHLKFATYFWAICCDVLQEFSRNFPEKCVSTNGEMWIGLGVTYSTGQE